MFAFIEFEITSSITNKETNYDIFLKIKNWFDAAASFIKKEKERISTDHILKHKISL